MELKRYANIAAFADDAVNYEARGQKVHSWQAVHEAGPASKPCVYVLFYTDCTQDLKVGP